MSNGLKAILLAMGIIATCALTAVLSYALGESRSAASASAEKISAAKLEYTMADFALLSGNEFSGSEVVSSVKKYQRKVSVQVVTTYGSTSYPNASFTVPNKEGTTSWVNPTKVFTCEVTSNANGVITQLTFVENELKQLDDTDITAAGAKLLMVDALQGSITMTDSWDKIVSEVKAAGNQGIKKQIVDAVGGTLDDSMRWSEIANGVTLEVGQLKEKLAEARLAAAQSTPQKTDGTLYAGESVTLPFTPETIAVITENGAQVFHSGVWSGGDSCSLFNDTLVNNGSFTIVYSAYK